MTITPNLVRLGDRVFENEVFDHQVIGDGGSGSESVGDTIGLRIDNKDRGIMLRADPVLDFNENGDNWGERVYLFVKIDQPAGIRSLRVRMVVNTPWSGDDASVDNWGEWDVDVTDYQGGWYRVVLDPYKQHWDRQGPGGVGLDPKWRWVGIMVDMENVSGKGSNVWLRAVDVGTGIKVHDIASALDWESLYAIDQYGMLDLDGSDQFSLLGDIEFENVIFDSNDEHIILLGTDIVVGPGCDYRSTNGTIIGSGDCHIDFNNAQFVSIAATEFYDIVGDPFTAYSIRFADNPEHAVLNGVFSRCGLVLQQSTNFIDAEIVDPVPQPATFIFVTSYRKVQDVTLDGLSLLAAPEGKFEPFETCDDNKGDVYWVGAPVPFNKLYFEGDLFQGGYPQWSYWTTSGWQLLTVTGEKAHELHGEVTFVAPPDWQKLAGLYQLRIEIIEGLYAIMPNPIHRFAFYSPVV